jgi:ribosome-associated toxin RatA of RatAB toxin-antitoxin module
MTLLLMRRTTVLTKPTKFHREFCNIPHRSSQEVTENNNQELIPIVLHQYKAMCQEFQTIILSSTDDTFHSETEIHQDC